MARRVSSLILLALASTALVPLGVGGCERETTAPSETDETDRLTQELLAKLRLDEHDAASTTDLAIATWCSRS